MTKKTPTTGKLTEVSLDDVRATQTPAIGVPYDDGPAGFETSNRVYTEIERGDYDAILDNLDRMIRSRVRYDQRRGPKAPVPDGLDKADLLLQVQHGFFGRHTSMLGEAVRNRRVILKNQALADTINRLKANPPTLTPGDRVRVHPDAPLKRKWMVLVGRTATVDKVPTRGKPTITFDDNQPLGPLTQRTTPFDAWMLERLDDIPSFPLTHTEARLLAALADQEHRARVEANLTVADGIDLDTLDDLTKRLQAYGTQGGGS